MFIEIGDNLININNINFVYTQSIDNYEILFSNEDQCIQLNKEQYTKLKKILLRIKK